MLTKVPHSQLCKYHIPYRKVNMRISLLLIVAFAMAMYIVSTPTTAGISGEWFQIPNINDPQIQELGGWTVKQHNVMTNDRLKFNGVVSGDEQVVEGMNYRLNIKTSNPDGKYQAVVNEVVWSKTRTLLSFHPAE
ncbi:hypothetical protein EJB05_07595, partial [Eragrostis curvula]